jgi:hypothetical protein
MMTRPVVAIVSFFATLQQGQIASFSNQFVEWSRNRPREPRVPDNGHTWDGRCQTFAAFCNGC